MLVFSDKSPTRLDDFPTTTRNAEFFAAVAKKIGKVRPAILLVGAADFASWTVRVQQAVMRFDRRPSDYSHAALLCAWDLAQPERSWGLELDAVRVAASAQRPEHGGVTPFRISDYLDDDAFPNLAVIDVPPVERGSHRAIVEAARRPMRDAVRFPLLRWLAAWRAFVTAPEAMSHPLLNRIPHPGAGFVAMAYEAAEVTLIPGAVDMQHCPELLWANAKHWGEAVGANVRIYRLLRDPDAKTRKAAPVPIDESATAPASAARRPQRSRRRGAAR
jgi:hypothetical protein